MNRDAVISVSYTGSLGRFTLDAAFEVPMRGVTALFGPSGCGKTTVLRCLAGLTHLSGRLVVGGEVWQDGAAGIFRPPHERPIGYVFQEASLFPHLSVRGNLLYGLRRALKAGACEATRLGDVVALLGIGHLLDRAPARLSGGERQRVAVGRALLSQPRLLLMDEPLSALDRMTKEGLLPYFEALHEALAIPILYVSHDISEVERLADHMVLLDSGRVIACGPLADVLADSRLPIARASTAATVLESRVQAFDPEDGLTTLRIDGGTLMVPGQVGQPGAACRVRIAAEDVSLAADRPSRTSILNVLAARIRTIEPVNAAQANVIVTLGDHGQEGARLLARITNRSLAALGFAPGLRVYAQIKAASIVDPSRAAMLERRPEPVAAGPGSARIARDRAYASLVPGEGRTDQRVDEATPITKSPARARRPLFSFLIGGSAGSLGGLIGLGGAEFRLPALVGALRFTPRDAIPVNLAISFLVLLAALPARTGAVAPAGLLPYWPEFVGMTAGAMTAAFIGAGFLKRTSDRVLGHLIFVLLLALGFVMIAEGLLGHGESRLVGDAVVTVALVGAGCGAVIGLVSSLLGVAGGELIIPAFVIIFGVPMKDAGSLSMLVSLPTIAVGLMRHLQVRSVLREASIWRHTITPMGAGSILGAVAGGLLLGLVPGEALKSGLGAILIWSAFGVFRHRPVQSMSGSSASGRAPPSLF